MLDPHSGEIKATCEVVAVSVIGGATGTTYTLEASVTDGGGLSDTAVLTIDITELNYPPHLEPIVISMNEACTGACALTPVVLLERI